MHLEENTYQDTILMVLALTNIDSSIKECLIPNVYNDEFFV